MASSTAEKDIQELNGKLYKALLNEDGVKVTELCAVIEDHALHIMTIHNDTVLHKATFSKQGKLVLRLLEALPPRHLHKMTSTNDTGNTILHEAATLRDHENSVEVATEMLKKAPKLLCIRNKFGETALFRAARYGKTEIFNFLAYKILEYDKAKQMPFIQRNDKKTILHIAILAQHFGLALEIANKFLHIIDERDEYDMTALQLLSFNPSAFETVGRQGLFKRISSSVFCSSARANELRKENLNNESALKLAKFLVKTDTSWELTTSATHDQSETKPHKFGGIPPLFLAIMSGCIEIVKEILETYPQAVEHIDNHGRTILHVAIMYRQLEIFKLVLKMKVAMRWVVRRLDNQENSILHMVGTKIEDHYVPEKLRGPALELQDELLWFERVKSITKVYFIDHENKDMQTAQGLFASTHKELRNDAKEWLKKTAEGCTVVAVLIATVAFAAAYTIPGGPNQITGLPILLYQPFFVVFTATDVLSLAFALTSVVIFLSILTSPYRLDDFRRSLPNKLMLGVTFLFLSVSMMMIEFAATILLMIRSKQSWTKIFLYSLSFLPVGIFALSYLPLYVSLTRTYKFLLKKITHFLSLPLEYYPRQLTGSTKPKSERKDFNSLAAPQTSHLSV